LHVPIGIGVGLLHSLLVATTTPLFIWRPSFVVTHIVGNA
jgi:hypothetical protein